MHQATLPWSILTHRLACSHLTSPQSNTPTSTRTITRTWSLASRNHCSPSAVLSNHLLDGQQCRSCKLDILWLWMDFFRVFSRRMMGRYNFLRSKLSRSISWERRQCLLVPINLWIPVSLFYSFFEYFRLISILLEATSTLLKRKGLQFDFSQATPSPLKKARISDTPSSPSPLPWS